MPSDPTKLPVKAPGETLSLADLAHRVPDAHAFWLRMQRSEDDWEFRLTAGRLEAWRGPSAASHGAGLAFSWDFAESRWKMIT